MAGWPVQMLSDSRWPAEIELWHVAISEREGVSDEMTRLLDADERARADRYRAVADRSRFVATRSSLRALLARHVGAAPETLRFVTGPHGRPALEHYPAVSFNVSHTGPHALIALSSTRIVGVDVERLDMALDWRALTRLVCSAAEQRSIECAPVALQHDYFFRCWTAKEALLKALGLGITEGLLALTIELGGEGVQQPHAESAPAFSGAAALRFQWLRDLPGYLACIAYSEA